MAYKLSKYNIYYYVNNEYICIFNCLTKAMSLFKNIHNQQNSQLYIKDLNTLDIRIVSSLKQNGFILPESINEEVILKHHYYQRNAIADTSNILINLTHHCNFSCPYCYEKFEEYGIDNETISPESIVSFINKFIIPERRYLFLGFFGGEPLLKKDKLFKIADMTKEICDNRNVKMYVSIVTNGYLLDKDFIDTLVSKYKIRSLQVTLDGPPEIHDKRRFLKDGRPTFDVIFSNIIYAVDKLPRKTLDIRCNIDRTNLSYLDQLRNYLVLNNIYDKINFNIGKVWLVGDGEIRDRQDTVISELSDKCICEEMDRLNVKKYNAIRIADILSLDYVPCVSRTDNYYVIEPNGNIKKCFVDTSSERVIGNILQGFSLFNDIFMKYYLYEPWNNKPCSECPVIPMCFGGCINRRLFRDKGKIYCEGKKYRLQNMIIQLIKKTCVKNNINIRNIDLISHIDIEK